MLYQLIPFTEHWASIYKPMLHSENNKRFYCIESVANIANLAKELTNAQSPLVCIESNIGGDLSDKFMMPDYNVYFFVQAEQLMLDNDISDTHAKEEALRHALAFINYMRRDQSEKDRESAVAGVALDSLHFETYGPMFNRWFCVGVSMSQLSQFSLCVNEEDYIQELEE